LSNSFVGAREREQAAYGFAVRYQDNAQAIGDIEDLLAL
jgi:hypothetical protein